jgi:hypothetical protein
VNSLLQPFIINFYVFLFIDALAANLCQLIFKAFGFGRRNALG